MSSAGHTPPIYALKFLRWFCPKRLQEGIEGDLCEQFDQDVEGEGVQKAKARFIWNVFRFFRPGILFRNKVAINLIAYDMIRSYFTMAWRSMVRNGTYTFINITGLTLGLTIGIVLFWIVRFENSFDQFQTNVDRLYQVITNDRFGGVSSHVPQAVIHALQNEFPEVEKAASVLGWGPQVIRVDDENVKAGNTFFVHPEFLKMIDVKWITGSVESSLSKPYQVVVDEPTAKRLFHDENPLGKIIHYDNKMDLTVSGVIEKMPVNSMIQMPMIMNYETLTKYNQDYENENHWDGGDSWFHGYVLVKPGAAIHAIEDRLAAMAKQHEAETIYTGVQLVSITEAHFDLMNDPFNYVVPKWMLNVLLSIAFFLIIIACINFVNLATAQATQRSREIGMRKVMGGSRTSVVFQFLTETCVLVTFSVLTSCLLATQLVKYTDTFFSTQVNQVAVWDADMVLYIFILIVGVTLLAGLYPAFILSGFKPMNVIRKQFTSFSGRGITLRKSLVVTQFVIAQVMVISMVIGVQQVRIFYHTDPGFNKDAIVTVNMVYKDSVLLRDRFQQALLQYPEIKEVTYGLTSPSSTRNWWWGNATNPKLPDGEQQFRLQWIDENYFDFYNIPLVAGRNFVNTDTLPMALINEQAILQMGLTDAEEAIGEQLSYWGDNKVTVIGVVKNYYSQGLKSEIPPHLYLNGKWNFQLAQIKIDPLQSTAAIDHIAEHWKEIHPDNYFEYEFLADDLNSFYEDERKLSNFIILFASLSLLIGCLGLFGVVSFVCARRTKEVSVRKVLGASVRSILSLLSKDFVILVVIAFAIAIPIGWFIMNEFLQRYTYQVEIHWSVFALAGGITLLIALFTVVLRSFRIALSNPAENLKYE